MMYHIVYLSFESKPGGKSYVGKHSTENLKEKLRARSNDHNKGKRWYTNGEETRMFPEGFHPAGWSRGRG